MNMFNFHIKSDVEKVYQIGEQKGQKYLASIRLRKGHKLWQFKDGVVSQVKLTKTESIKDAVFNTGITKHQVQVEKGVYYTEALNLKNAKRRFVKHQGLVCK